MVTSESPDDSSTKPPFPNLFSFWRKHKEDSRPWMRLYRRFTLKELRVATHNFSSRMGMGRGDFSRFYKGVFNGGFKETVVIKMYDNDGSLQSHETFLKEMESASSKRDHPNILSLIGYCIQGSHRCIVFEYMPHTTLYDQLHSKIDPNSLPWKKRLEICIGVARAIEFLHSGNPFIIHRNIKTSNILLDNNCFAKISGFQISKLVEKPDSDLTTSVVGTLGYLDPEYLSGHLTAQSDVYSFGVVLFEVLSARKPIDFALHLNLMQRWRRCFEDDMLGEIIDPRIKDEVAPDCLKAYADIAYKCSNERASERPTMPDVVKRLELILLFLDCIQADVPLSLSWLRSTVSPQEMKEPCFGTESLVVSDISDISVSDYDSEELLRD